MSSIQPPKFDTSQSFTFTGPTPKFKLDAPAFKMSHTFSADYKSDYEEEDLKGKKRVNHTGAKKIQVNSQKDRRKACKGKTPSQIIAEWGIDHTKYKTEICKNWIEIGNCRYGKKCQFAHGTIDKVDTTLLNSAIGAGRSDKYKSKECVGFFTNSWCSYGSRCLFKHECRPFSEVHHYYYATLMCCIDTSVIFDKNCVDLQHQILSANRLKIFSDVINKNCHIKEDVHSENNVLFKKRSMKSETDSEQHCSTDESLASAETSISFTKDHCEVSLCLWSLQEELDQDISE